MERARNSPAQRKRSQAAMRPARDQHAEIEEPLMIAEQKVAGRRAVCFNRITRRVGIFESGLDRRSSRLVQKLARARQAMAVADLVLHVDDRSRPRSREDVLLSKVLYVANKSDLEPAWRDDLAVAVSAVTGDGLDELRRRILDALDVEPRRDRPAMTNVRHIALVDRAHAALTRARDAASADGGSLPEEFVLADLADARAAFEEISGRRTPDDVLEHIFAKFCVGK